MQLGCLFNMFIVYLEAHYMLFLHCTSTFITIQLKKNVTFQYLILLRPLQFNYLSHKLYLEKKSCQTPKKNRKKIDFGVLQT